MKHKLIWKILLLLGICPFLAPFASFLYKLINAESWSLPDWLIMYSFLYWPTYVAGVLLIAVSIYKLRKGEKR